MAERIWKSSGGDETITLTSLGSGAGRVGDQWDFGTTPKLYRVSLRVELGASTSLKGEGVQLYLARAPNGFSTQTEGEVGASDAALSDEDNLQNMLFIGAARVDDEADATAQLNASFIFALAERYGSPVVWNATSDALSATAGNHEIRIEDIRDL